MNEYKIAFDAVREITGIFKSKILSRSRVWSLVEARMLFVLLLSRQGVCDQKIAWILDRTRPTILAIRHNAENYIKQSRVFADKYALIKQVYESCKISIAQEQV